jgi:hypothetical protein
MMIGKGSVNHNSRSFHAQNTDPERSHLNQCYCNEPIKEVYHKLFDDAVARYNDKQTRSDRKIDNYYEKIRAGKQEKLFHEVIFQIGNKDDMGAATETGDLSVKILDAFISDFQKRNLNLYVFSSHLHMDEATPHLHIDFVPYITGSKRGLDTRVSLKQALATQGFTGGTRQETEWNQWVLSEKEQLAKAMERHGIEWEQLGTTGKHLSVINYEKEQRTKEVAALEYEIGSQEHELGQLTQQKQELQSEIETADKKHAEIAKRLAKVEKQENLLTLNTRRYDEEPEWQLPEPPVLMTAKTYNAKIVAPFINKLKKVIRSIVAQYLELKSSVNDLRRSLSKAQERAFSLSGRLDEVIEENAKLKEIAHNYSRVKKVLGQEQVGEILQQAREAEQVAVAGRTVHGRRDRTR